MLQLPLINPRWGNQSDNRVANKCSAQRKQMYLWTSCSPMQATSSAAGKIPHFCSGTEPRSASHCIFPPMSILVYMQYVVFCHGIKRCSKIGQKWLVLVYTCIFILTDS